MLLRNLHSADHGDGTDICIQAGNIAGIGNGIPAKDEKRTISFQDAIVLPGLINSHDHLDFNMYPQLGSRHYNSYTEWGKDIHERYSDTIKDVQKIPLHLRTKWGVYKNLLNGVTTVVNHGEVLNPGNDIITVFEQCHVIHSVGFEPRWKRKLLSPKGSKVPTVIHVGEGTNEDSMREIDRLIKWNLLKRQIIGVHGVAMTETQARHFSGLVWCPASNYFLLGKTAQMQKLKGTTNVVFGTDSTLSAEWNMWEHIRMARDTRSATDAELLAMLTSNAATLWQLPRTGKLKAGYDADIVVAKKKESTYYDSFFATQPEDILLVVCKGDIKLFDSSLYEQLQQMNVPMDTYCKAQLNNSTKYVIGNLDDVIQQTKEYYPAAELPVT